MREDQVGRAKQGGRASPTGAPTSPTLKPTPLRSARGIIEGADLLVLDEPTNHLDIEGISYLKNVLNKRTLGETAVLCVTHDRDFLDTLADEVMELEMGELYRYRFQGGRSDR